MMSDAPKARDSTADLLEPAPGGRGQRLEQAAAAAIWRCLRRDLIRPSKFVVR